MVKSFGYRFGVYFIGVNSYYHENVAALHEFSSHNYLLQKIIHIQFIHKVWHCASAIKVVYNYVQEVMVENFAKLILCN